MTEYYKTEKLVQLPQKLYYLDSLLESLGLKGQKKTAAACPHQTNDPKNGSGEVKKVI